MNEQSLPRSPELMSRDDSALVVVDVQEKLIGLIHDQERVVWNIGRLIDAARLLGLPVVATEQYPKGLGPTTPALAERLQATDDSAACETAEKIAFSCGECGSLFAKLREQGRFKLLLAGIEAHVCVQQTAFDLTAAGFRVYLAADAVGSRHGFDRQIALRRMESCGASLTTTEAAMFEWCERAGTPEFKEISRLVRKSGPPS